MPDQTDREVSPTCLAAILRNEGILRKRGGIMSKPETRMGVGARDRNRTKSREGRLSGFAAILNKNIPSRIPRQALACRFGSKRLLQLWLAETLGPSGNHLRHASRRNSTRPGTQAYQFQLSSSHHTIDRSVGNFKQGHHTRNSIEHGLLCLTVTAAALFTSVSSTIANCEFVMSRAECG